jgi:hypothetical protein
MLKLAEGKEQSLELNGASELSGGDYTGQSSQLVKHGDYKWQVNGQRAIAM